MGVRLLTEGFFYRQQQRMYRQQNARTAAASGSCTVIFVAKCLFNGFCDKVRRGGKRQLYRYCS
jgi:hypothetical protein